MTVPARTVAVLVDEQSTSGGAGGGWWHHVNERLCTWLPWLPWCDGGWSWGASLGSRDLLG